MKRHQQLMRLVRREIDPENTKRSQAQARRHNCQEAQMPFSLRAERAIDALARGQAHADVAGHVPRQAIPIHPGRKILIARAQSVAALFVQFDLASAVLAATKVAAHPPSPPKAEVAAGEQSQFRIRWML